MVKTQDRPERDKEVSGGLSCINVARHGRGKNCSIQIEPTLSRTIPMCKTDRFLALLGVLVLATLLTFADATLRVHDASPRLAASAALVRDLGLTDLALFTEARYTRHLSQADLHTAFQDHPLAFEHFPSGSLYGPPPHLRLRHAELAATTEVSD
jgi:hypothetical protein